MDAFWSVNNTATSPTDIDAGELSTSFYRSDLDSLFLLGDAGTDTEEFDDHVSIHEWGHYFEDVFSRSDSIGGSHAGSQSLDARLAFGEGWATALAAMALDDPQYCDTGAAGTSSGFGIDTENYNFGAQGWFNEMSVATFLYDLWDTEVDADANGTDADSIGFGPIFETMAGPQKNTAAFTTLFSFAAELRPMLNTTQRPVRRLAVGAREHRNSRYRYLGQYSGQYLNLAEPGARRPAAIYDVAHGRHCYQTLREQRLRFRTQRQ